MKLKTRSHIALLVSEIQEGYSSRAWHGPNLRGSIRGLSIAEVCWRPGSKRHNIWEIVVHCAYWKYIVRRRILGEKRGSFPLEGSNWFERPEHRTLKSWKADMELLDAMHGIMVEAIGDLKDTDLSKIPRGSKVDNRSIISGIAMHDVYHAGQIQLIKRLLR
jgi:uncharacterized damage-inducible protein DinB